MPHTQWGIWLTKKICMNDLLTSLRSIRETYIISVSVMLTGVCTMAWTPLFFFLLHCTGQESHLYLDPQLGEIIWQRDIFYLLLISQHIHNKFLYFQGLSPNLCWLSYPLLLLLWEAQSNSPVPWVKSTAPTPLNGTSNIQRRLLSTWCMLRKMEATIRGMGSLNASLAPALELIDI